MSFDCSELFAMFLKNYFYYRAYQDGMHGFIISLLEGVSRVVRHIPFGNTPGLRHLLTLDQSPVISRCACIDARELYTQITHTMPASPERRLCGKAIYLGIKKGGVRQNTDAIRKDVLVRRG